ncbi:hypothetical protein [Methanosarcina vacuolata]|uniref:Uncharacterized protein n=1 Tax=Methanosarcina vacuolata Z-761 TaxID=1434123 RepID=A0A0E3Q6E5_9EURY|nr:hypothetical protein [Methanosarcina vacuolata]AKB44284.1 hypothetical protein MSVAZ_2015 [Methanosarcina vacuolata Z-761]
MYDDNVNSLQMDARESIIQAGLISIARSIPSIGVVVDAFMEHKNNNRWNYVGKFFEDVSQQMGVLEEKINELCAITDPNEILHLMYIAIDNVEFEYQESRRTKYAELFVNSILLGNQINFDEKRFFFHLFNELSDADISFLGKFFQKSAETQSGVPLKLFRPNLSEVVPIVARLESRGLIVKIFDVIDGGGASGWDESITNLDSQWQDKIYDFTPVGVKFCRFLSGDQ